MELSLSTENTAFRDEVRAFIAENYRQEMRVGGGMGAAGLLEIIH
jgi:hypothetical protein